MAVTESRYIHVHVHLHVSIASGSYEPCYMLRLKSMSALSLHRSRLSDKYCLPAHKSLVAVSYMFPAVHAMCRGAWDCSFLWSTRFSADEHWASFSESSCFTLSTSSLCTARHRDSGSCREGETKKRWWREGRMERTKLGRKRGGYVKTHIYTCMYTYTVYLDIEKYHESFLLTLCNNLHISPPMERLRAVRPAASLANSLAPAARRLLARATWL